uniref:hypothetical protein n=1 Tax=Pontibacterium sp. TaxID=2036026 RepID=UPI003513A5C5
MKFFARNSCYLLLITVTFLFSHSTLAYVDTSNLAHHYYNAPTMLQLPSVEAVQAEQTPISEA